MLAAVDAVFKIANVRGAHYDQDAKYQLIYTDPSFALIPPTLLLLCILGIQVGKTRS